MQLAPFNREVLVSAKKKEAEGLVVPEQSEEMRAEILASAPKGADTATGQAFAHDSGEEEERIEGLENRGSDNPIAGGEGIVADYSGQETQEPIGLMAQPAHFTVSGTINPTEVASPSGPVPLGSVTASLADAQKRIEEQHKSAEASVRRRRSSLEPLTQAQIDSMSGAELRAVAVDRGYEMADGGGTRTTRRKFAEAQEADTRFSGREADAGETPEGSEG
jgi:hypothetical protein